MPEVVGQAGSVQKRFPMQIQQARHVVCMQNRLIPSITQLEKISGSESWKRLLRTGRGRSSVAQQEDSDLIPGIAS